MKVSTIPDLIDSGYMALPKFQRGYVWKRDQVRGLMDSLYRRHPVGSLLVWATAAEGASHRGEHELAPGVVRLLLDGQQRITSLYGIIRGAPPTFARNILWVPAAARWSVLQAQARQSTIGQTVDEAMTAIEEANPALRDVLPKDYARLALDN